VCVLCVCYPAEHLLLFVSVRVISSGSPRLLWSLDISEFVRLLNVNTISDHCATLRGYGGQL